MPDYRDRNNNYVPERLRLGGCPQYAEIGARKDLETGEKKTLKARVAHGLPDELNRDRTWWWADVSGDGTLGRPGIKGDLAGRATPAKRTSPT